MLQGYAKELFTEDDAFNIFYDYRFEHPENFDPNECSDPLIVDGKPFYDADGHYWALNAHDSKADYQLIADADGNASIAYIGTR